MKKILLILAEVLSCFWRILPARWREKWITGWIVLESRGDPAMGLRQLLRVRDQLDWVINERAMTYGEGEHPKHRLTDYHRFFIERIQDGDCVIDIGCGYGAVSRSIARARPQCTVTGIDQDMPRLSQALAADNPDNLSFVGGDATRNLPQGPWDVVVLSNVLEHIVERVGFLKKLQSTTGADRFLIRVPLFEREWQMALRRELDVEFRSDPDHKVEHELRVFIAEINQAGLNAVELQTLWGEIWADCRRVGA